MKLQLKRPLVVFDLETTGISVTADRIVEICMLKVNPDGQEEIRTYRVNPEMPIPAGASEVHGIYDADIADKPIFKTLAPEINTFLKDCDFYRAGIDFDIEKRKFIDAQRIYHFKEPRNLKAALKFYCEQDLENAHSAEADTVATWQVLKAQIERYEDIPHDIDGLHKMSGQSNLADLAGRLIIDNKGETVFNFGKHRGKSVKEILKNEPSYYKWMMDGDFPQQTKMVLTRIRLSLRNE